MTKGNSASGDQIQVQSESGYDIYYLSDGWFAGKGGAKTYYADRDGKWFKGTATTPATGMIPVGCGAWYIRKGEVDFAITINSPIAK